MALVVKDRVQETSTTTGTGTLTLSGAVTGFQTFSSAIGNTNTTYYTIQNGSEWEVGIGTVGAGTLSRGTVLESSNSGSLVDFTAGSKLVFCTYPAEKSVDIETAQTLTNKTISGANNTLSNIGNSSLTNSSITINGSATSLGGSISVGTVTSVGGGNGLTGSVTSSGDLALGTPSTLTTSTTNAVTADSHTHAVTFPVTSVNGATGAVSVGTVTSVATSGGLTGGTITTSGTISISDGGVTPAKLSTGAPSWDSSGNLSFNSGYGSVATAYGCRAWVNFNGTTNNNLSGTYSQSGTTVTVTATSHGLTTGNSVYLDITTGTAVDGTYEVTVTGTNTFTVQQASRTTSGNVSILRSTIRGSGNVSSIAYRASGVFTVNFITTMPDANYAVIVTGDQVNSEDTTVGAHNVAFSASAVSSARAAVYCTGPVGNTPTAFNSAEIMSVAIFR